MSQLAQRQGFKVESTLPKKKKHKEKRVKPLDHVKIIDDDAPVLWNNETRRAAATADDDELNSFEDAPVVVGLVDERPKELREKERFNDAKRWRTSAFEEVPPAETIRPQPKSSSRRERQSSDDSDSEVNRRRPTSRNDTDLSPPRRRTQRKDPSDDDRSPPRRRRKPSDDDPSPPRRRDHHSSSRSRSRHNDSSPPRRQIKKEADASPPRRKHKDDDRPRIKNEPQTPKIDQRPSKRRDSSPPRNERRSKQESPSRSTTSQPAKSERRRLAEHKEEIAERYAAWGRGIAQVKQSEQSVKDYIETSQKPLARYRNDQDLDAVLKTREREDDPMLKYLTPKPAERSSDGSVAPVKPRYRGPDPQKNRFDIWPGYRWDGVDRSNGYERRLFESIANRHAKAQEAYLWSVEDM